MVTGEAAFHVLRALMDDDDWPDLASLLERPAWHSQAACRGMGPALFFPERGQPTAPARAVCATCPVSAQCHAQAAEGDEAGVWAGTSVQERRRRLVA